MNERTTTRAAIESRAQKEARRAAAAHARHAAPTFAPMTATAGEHAAIFPALPDMTPRALYHLPELCAALVVRARERETGLKLFSELKAAARRDSQIMHHRAERAERAAEARAEYEEARTFAAELDRIASRMGTPADIAEAAAEAARDERTHRNAAREEAEAIEKAEAAATTSERATLVQAAAAELVAMMTAGEDLTAAIPQLCAAASAALAELSNPDSMTRVKTVTRWLNRDEAAELVSRYSIDLNATPPQKIPAAMTKASAACYKTIEARERKAERAALGKIDPAALARKAVTADGEPICMVYHYKTVAPYVTFTQFEAPENAPELSTNGGINAIFNQTDRERITALFDRAKLTDRERLLCLYAANQTADSRAKKARAESLKADAERIAATDKKHRAQERKRAEARADKAAAAERWTYAFDRLSRTDSGTRYTTATRDKYRQRIAAALARARTAPEAPTAEERAAAERRYWEAMQRNSRRAAAPITAARADLVAAASVAAASVTAPAPVVNWTAPTPHEYTNAAEERAAQREAAEAAAAERVKNRIAAAEEKRRTERPTEYHTRAADVAATRAFNAFFDMCDYIRENRDTLPAAALVELTAKKRRLRAELERAEARRAAAASVKNEDWTPNPYTQTPAAALIAFQMLNR